MKEKQWKEERKKKLTFMHFVIKLLTRKFTLFSQANTAADIYAKAHEALPAVGNSANDLLRWQCYHERPSHEGHVRLARSRHLNGFSSLFSTANSGL